jgi:hypothetical protein
MLLSLTLEENMSTRNSITGHLSANFPVAKRSVCMLTNLPFPTALERINTYREAYKQRYPTTALWFRLIGVSEFRTEHHVISDELLHQLDVVWVEKLPQHAELFQ